MSLSIGYDIGIKSLLASQSALQTIGNNVANANTPGFSREQVIMGESAPVMVGGLSLGTGVDIAQIRRVVDEGLDLRILANRSALARMSTENSGLQQIESIWNGAGGNGLPASLNSFFSNLGTLANHPDDTTSRKSAVTSGNDIANALRDLSANLKSFRDDQRFAANLRVQEANSISSQIADLNGQIANLKTRNVDAHALKDRRQQLLNDLGEIASVETIPSSNDMVRVLVGGTTIVSGEKSHEMALDYSNNNNPVLKVNGAIGEVAVGNGAIAGLLNLTEQNVPSLTDQANQFAKSMILAFNRVHSTGVPAAGGFDTLQGDAAPAGGSAGTTIPLANAGLGVDVKKGDLYVTVRDTNTGDITKSKISIDPAESIADFAAKVSGIGHLSATIDAAGKIRISADAGFKFDFSPRLDTNPDSNGAFGGASASVSSQSTGPFTLTGGSTMQISVDGGAPQTISFQSSQFSDITKATAEEIAAAIGGQLVGAKAVADHGRVSIVSTTTGAASTIQITDGTGSPAAALGFPSGADAGSETAANAQISGAFTGGSNDVWTFKADADGQIGVTPNLSIGVYDATGNRIATLPVGQGYSPNTKISIKDGVEVSFGPGSISQSSNDAFSVDVVANSDSSDILSALGLNTFFSGNDITNISVRADLLAHSELFSNSLSGAPNDAGNIVRLMNIQKQDQSALGGSTLPGFLTEATSDLAIDTKRAGDLESSQQTLVDNLSQQREQVSGVSLEEEMSNLVRYQQAFQASSQYLRVLQETSSSLLGLIQ
ncbi:MAG: flagellar hook-associated protein FlgK [Planctomycetes bacterium]|nr:flagellar hook-associated protein FlgK [Planctomycetota bacterium]